MLAAYRAREFAKAEKMAKAAGDLAPDDIAGLYIFYRRRFAELAKGDLARSWAPVIALDEK
jgi:hypothetical protein